MTLHDLIKRQQVAESLAGGFSKSGMISEEFQRKLVINPKRVFALKSKTV